MENGPFIDDFPINTSIYKGFSMAMLNNQMVYYDWSWLIPGFGGTPWLETNKKNDMETRQSIVGSTGQFSELRMAMRLNTVPSGKLT